jgi:hypothetical protein
VHNTYRTPQCESGELGFGFRPRAASLSGVFAFNSRSHQTNSRITSGTPKPHNTSHSTSTGSLPPASTIHQLYLFFNKRSTLVRASLLRFPATLLRTTRSQHIANHEGKTALLPHSRPRDKLGPASSGTRDATEYSASIFLSKVTTVDLCGSANDRFN